jgi:hypothetical protein
MFEIQAIAVEFCNRGGANDHTFGILEFEDVEGEKEGLAE